MFGQRTSCYVQQREIVPESLGHTGSESGRAPTPKHDRDHELENGNTILIFEDSTSNSIYDTLISARQKWESRWRRLPFYLAYDAGDSRVDDNQLPLQCIKLVLKDIWRANAEGWEKFLDVAGTHVGILEDKIYEFPADESRADEIWSDSSSWLKAERALFAHQDTLNQLQASLEEMADDPSSSENTWLETNQADFQRLSTRLEEDLVKPTSNLSDLMYKSVGIRDSRHSLELSYSMWRLSWITFVFLPLTFTVGFFGMNVELFGVDNAPSVKWFFIVAAPLMLVVLISYTILQRQVARSRPDPYPRGIFERLFRELATDYPFLWSRAGPRDLLSSARNQRTPSTGLPSSPTRRGGLVRSRAEKIKWGLVQRWNAPSDTIARDVRAGSDQFDGLSTWSRLKRTLTRRWTAEIGAGVRERLNDPAGVESGHVLFAMNGAVHEKSLNGGKGKRRHHANANVRIEEPDAPKDSAKLRVPPAIKLRNAMTEPIERPSSTHSDANSSGGGNSLMVEEQKPGWLHGTAPH